VSRNAAALLAAIMLLRFGASGVSATEAAVEKPRGLWFWGKPASPYGALTVIGNATAEREALDTFRRWHVRRVYGSYAQAPRERAAVVAAWNHQLHAAGVQSHSLFSDNEAITANGRAGLLRLVEERVLRFNGACAERAERFDGVALDVEPHATPRWKTATPEARRAMLEEFLVTCEALRAFLDHHDARHLTLSVALAYWLDRVAPVGAIGWRSAADRDAWFVRLGRSVANISLMAYERREPAAIRDAVAWERAHFPGVTITALRARLGFEWKTLADLQAALPAVEAGDGPGVDLENYELLRRAEAAAMPR
jgi:hypothetical protein